VPAIICRMKPYIQPFERQLAIAELKSLSDGNVTPVDGDLESARQFSVNGKTNPKILIAQLAYWETVGAGAQAFTHQVRREATYAIARNGATIQQLVRKREVGIEKRPPNRRCLRYATHGIHEYRGKFFPQLVRSLLNFAQVPSRGVVVDPMCGSGTTLVEAAIVGRRSFGLDMNPLSVFVSDVKCRLLSEQPRKLVSAFDKLSRRTARRVLKLTGNGYFANLPPADQEYLGRWFAESSLAELDYIVAAIEELNQPTIMDFYKTCLSNILREVSWQKSADLRVRKEKKVLASGLVVDRFLSEVLRSTRSIAAFLMQEQAARVGRHQVVEADARNASAALRSVRGRVDAIITSPPYATALPYLDTDRLSLIYLGLLTRSDHRQRDFQMIGNREITERQRSAQWKEFGSKRGDLPQPTVELIERIDQLNHRKPTGFRRRNLSALLSKYFLDMREVMLQMSTLLKANGMAFMVVGNNRTTAGGVEIEIQTAEHLALIAQSVGFHVQQKLSMDMLASRDIFRKNTMPSEQILFLKRS
jgi:DNA modification methylase